MRVLHGMELSDSIIPMLLKLVEPSSSILFRSEEPVNPKQRT